MKALGFFVRLALIVTTLAAFIVVCHAHANQLQSPTIASNLNGVWINVNPKTRGLVRIEIQNKKIHPYGACYPDPCDWGVLKVRSFASTVDSGVAVALTAKQTTSFSNSEITLSLEHDGRLRAEVFTHFTDSSGRAD